MEWLMKLLGGLTQARPGEGADAGKLTDMLGEAIPPQLRELGTNLPGQEQLRSMLQNGELPTQLTDAAKQALDALPQNAGGFVEQGMALLKDRFKL